MRVSLLLRLNCGRDDHVDDLLGLDHLAEVVHVRVRERLLDVLGGLFRALGVLGDFGVDLFVGGVDASASRMASSTTSARTCRLAPSS